MGRPPTHYFIVNTLFHNRFRTPDPTVDIPTRRFQGMVRAWRKALHFYDPPTTSSTQQPTKDCEVTNNLVENLTQILTMEESLPPSPTSVAATKDVWLLSDKEVVDYEEESDDDLL